MTNSVTNRQMVFIIFLSITTYTTIDLPKIMAEAAGRSSWIPILIVSIFFCGCCCDHYEIGITCFKGK